LIYQIEKCGEISATVASAPKKLLGFALSRSFAFGVLRKILELQLRTIMASFNPTQIFADDVTEEKGENARLSAFVGAIAVGDLVKSTLGPKGMDKILQSA
jgi:hypothetical protein